MKLYELTKILADLDNEIDKDNLPPEEIALRLDQFSVQFEFKAVQIAKMILNYESDMAQLKEEEQRLYNKRQALNGRVDSLKKYLLGNMEELGINSVNYETVRILVQDNPYSVGEVLLDNLPPEFIRIIPEQKTADKKAILEHFKQTGEIPPGVSEISRSKRLVIK